MMDIYGVLTYTNDGENVKVSPVKNFNGEMKGDSKLVDYVECESQRKAVSLMIQLRTWYKKNGRR